MGSTRVVLSADGAVYDWNDYEPFGTVINSSGGQQNSDRLSYIGKEQDAESDLGDFGVRKYESETGRFLSTDPLWEKYRKLTPYHYCGNSPLIYRDPTGFGEEEVNKAAQDVQETMAKIEANAEISKQGNEFGATGVRQADGSMKMSDIAEGDGGAVTISIKDADVSIHSHTPYGTPTTASAGDILKFAFSGKQGSIHFITAGDGNRVAVEINDVEAARKYAKSELVVGEKKAEENVGFQLSVGMISVGGRPKNLSIADIPTNVKSKGVAKILDQNDTGMSIYVQSKEGIYEKK